MMVELAIGDAYGAAFEYASREVVETCNDGAGYHVRKTGEPRREGRYTDDTQMSIAVTEAILSDEPWTPALLADYFVTAFRRDPRKGYARGFQVFLEATESGEQFLGTIQPHSDKSGAAMRAIPCGIFPTVAEVIEKTTLQAKLTHDTPDGIAAARAAALMSHYFLYALGPKAEVGEFLVRHVTTHHWNKPWQGKVGSKGWMSVWAAVSAVMAYDSMTDILRACVAYGGDVDTVATIALGAAASSTEVKHDLPDALIIGLENGTYGRNYLAGLNDQLLARVKREPK